MDFREAFCKFTSYFVKNSADFSQLNTRTFSSGIRKTRSYDETLEILHSEIKKIDNSIAEISLDNFLIWSYHLIVLLQKNVNLREIYKDKDNECVFHFVTRLLEKIDKINEDHVLDESKIKELRLIHSEMICMFGSGMNLDLQKIVDQRVESMINYRLNNLDSERICQSQQNIGTANNDVRRFISDNMIEFRPLSRMINKKLRFENHKIINEIHTANKSTPSSLFYNRFPIPFFADDEDFVSKQNKIIERYQTDTLDLIKQVLDEKITSIDSRIVDFQEKLTGKNLCKDFEFADLVKELNNTEEQKIREYMIRSKNRAERVERRPLVATKFNKNTRNFPNHGGEQRWNKSHVAPVSSFGDSTTANTSFNSNRSVSFEQYPRSILTNIQGNRRDSNNFRHANYKNSYDSSNHYQNNNHRQGSHRQSYDGNYQHQNNDYIQRNQRMTNNQRDSYDHSQKNQPQYNH